MKFHFPYDKIGGIGIYLSSTIIAVILGFSCIFAMGKPTIWMFAPVIFVAIVMSYLLWNEPVP